ncbi:DUF2795 domain-containing protein [Stutzerimonas azotifigens]|uniref:DUF2795 domain-containing protein n=1 Tax=Stutzerimonas azotifigens TaxID=291995 RepID=UPI0004200155|nr:DUF2795 domain-containing protein [Stutzerimonas azotifigens]
MARGMGGHSPSNIAHHLKGIDFPASKDDLIQQAKNNGADSEVLESIKNMPDDEYTDMAGIMQGYGDSH